MAAWAIIAKTLWAKTEMPPVTPRRNFCGIAGEINSIDQTGIDFDAWG